MPFVWELVLDVIWPPNISTNHWLLDGFFSIRNFTNGTEHTVIGWNIPRSNAVKNKPPNKEHQRGREGSKCCQFTISTFCFQLWQESSHTKVTFTWAGTQMTPPPPPPLATYISVLLNSVLANFDDYNFNSFSLSQCCSGHSKDQHVFTGCEWIHRKQVC